jgi:SnoaL-like domain
MSDVSTDRTIDADRFVDDYLAAWNAADPDTRAARIAALWREDATFTDPVADVTGREALSAVIGTVREQFAGCTFRPLPGADAHHDIIRLRWELVPDGGGEALVIGQDIAVLDGEGRVRAVHAFFDRVPAA